MGLQLACLVAVIAITLWRQVGHPSFVIVVGLATFNFVFAMNSSIQSYLILTYTDVESVSLNVGLYYMANAGGRLLGTLLSGWVCLRGGMQPCLWVSALFVGSPGWVVCGCPPWLQSGPSACQNFRPDPS